MATAEKLEQKVVSGQGKEVGSIELNPSVFAAPKRQPLIHAAVRWQRAKRRAGTHQALTRSMMKGGGKKPFKQKGTGNARAGSIISPLWVGGASVHGPLPRDYGYRFPRRTRLQAIASALSHKRASDNLMILEELNVKSGKTKDAVATLDKLKLVTSRGVLVVAEVDQKTALAFRNVPGVTLMSVAGVNVYDLLKHQYLIIAKNELETLQKRVLDSEQKLKRIKAAN